MNERFIRLIFMALVLLTALNTLVLISMLSITRNDFRMCFKEVLLISFIAMVKFNHYPSFNLLKIHHPNQEKNPLEICDSRLKPSKCDCEFWLFIVLFLPETKAKSLIKSV